MIAGAGTIGLELLEDVPDLQAVLVPIGGGGLISGVATAVKGLDARIEVIGVEVEASCAFSAARAAGHIVEIAVGETIADGLGGNVDPDTITWPFIRDLVDRIVVVPEAGVTRGSANARLRRTTSWPKGLGSRRHRGVRRAWPASRARAQPCC